MDVRGCDGASACRTAGGGAMAWRRWQGPQSKRPGRNAPAHACSEQQYHPPRGPKLSVASSASCRSAGCGSAAALRWRSAACPSIGPPTAAARHNFVWRSWEAGACPSCSNNMGGGNILRLRGLPYSATANDVTEFFKEYSDDVQAVYCGAKNGGCLSASAACNWRPLQCRHAVQNPSECAGRSHATTVLTPRATIPSVRRQAHWRGICGVFHGRGGPESSQRPPAPAHRLPLHRVSGAVPLCARRRSASADFKQRRCTPRPHPTPALPRRLCRAASPTLLPIS